MQQKNFINEMKLAFGSRFIDFRECTDNRYHLILVGEVFTCDDWQVITSRGFYYHIGFISVSMKGFDKKELRIELART